MQTQLKFWEGKMHSDWQQLQIRIFSDFTLKGAIQLDFWTQKLT